MVHFVDLKAQYHSIKAEIDAALQEVLESSQFVLGSKVAGFEERFAAYCQVEHAVAVNSGTSALHLALLAAGIGPGDEVITTAFTFVATVAAIEYAGATPVLVDIDPQTFTLAVDQIEPAITEHTKAILPVHLYGQPADMAPIMDIARKHHLVVIEDAAQAHGAEYNGQRAGSIGDLGCFSFYPGKNLGAYGEGGAVTTHNADYARTLRMLRDWGAEKKYHHELKGFNYRMEGFQGAVLGVKMKYIEDWTEARRAHARRYDDLLAGVEGVRAPVEMPYSRHVYHIYAIRAADRDGLQKALGEQGIHTGIHYPYPVHVLEAYQDLGYPAEAFPESVRAGQEVLSLPMYAELPDADVETVVEAVRKYVEN